MSTQPQTPGRKPFGDKPGERETLDFMLDCYRSGMGAVQIARVLNTADIPPRYGRLWQASSVNGIILRAIRRGDVEPHALDLPAPLDDDERTIRENLRRRQRRELELRVDGAVDAMVTRLRAEEAGLDLGPNFDPDLGALLPELMTCGPETLARFAVCVLMEARMHDVADQGHQDADPS